MMIVFIILLVSLLLFFWCTVENHMLLVHEYTVSDDALPDAFSGKKIVYLVDLHNTRYGKDNQRLKEKIAAQDPDYVFVGGDFLSKADTEFSASIDLLVFLTKRYPVYFANGNHETKMKCYPERYHDQYAQFYQMAKGLGVRFLSNETILLREEKDFIYLDALELPLSYFSHGKQVELTKKEMSKLIKRKAGGYHILLAHSPNYFETYAKWGADITLSGHNHGGMARIPGVCGVLSPQARIFPKYTKGLYQIDTHRMIVSAGLGSHTIRVRFFNPPELLAITLQK